MADAEELRQMILNFRCSELQVLLGFAGRNKAGRKQELQARALELLKLRSTPIQMKIKELHKRRYPGMPSSPKTGYPNTTSSPIGSSRSQATCSMKSLSDYGSSTLGTGPAQMAGPSGPYAPNGPLDYSAKHVLSSHPPTNNNYPVHPDVRLRRLPFYDILAELLKPASLVPSGSSRFQENNFVFHLTPQQAHDIAISRDMRPGVKLEYSIQVQLRFCLLETSCDQEDNFPPSICVKVNSKMCPLPNPIPTNKPGVEPKRPSRPVNVTALCRLSPTVSNHINVSWASEFGRGYAVAVYLVKRLSSTTLLQRLRAQGVRNADHTRALIKEKLAHDADSEIATTSLRVSLMCPLGKMRMQFPCRSSTCTHLQCFDASLYLQMNEKKPTWICPVCDKTAPFDHLVLDGLFLEIFSAAPECTEIQFHEDGSWSPLVPKKEPQVIGSPIPPKVVAPVAPVPATTQAAAPKPTEKVEVIDLTLESSDEEEMEVARSAPHQQTSLSSATQQRSDITVSTSAAIVTTNAGPSSSTAPSLSSNTGCVTSRSPPHIITIDSPSRPSSSSSSSSGSSPHQLSTRDIFGNSISSNHFAAAELRRLFLPNETETSHSSLSTNPFPPTQAEVSLDEVLQLGFIDRTPRNPFISSNSSAYHLNLDDLYPI